MHAIFAQVSIAGSPYLTLPLAVWRTVDWPALALSAAAVIAIFRFKTGMIATFAGCSAAGAIWYLATGTL